MSDKDLMKMVSILMEIPTERYYKFKNEILVKEFEEEAVNFLLLLFSMIEKNRPELMRV